MAVEGPMARDVGDLALMFDAMVGFDPGDPLTSPNSEPPFLDAAAFRGARDGRAAMRARYAAAHGLDARLPWILAVAMMRPGDKLASYQALARWCSTATRSGCSARTCAWRTSANRW